MNRALAAVPAPLLQRSRDPAWWSGCALAAALAALAMGAAELAWLQQLGLSALTLAIVLGMACGNTFFPAIARHTASGVDFSKSLLLRTGIVLYGFRITFQEVAGVGWTGIVIAACMVTLTFVVAVQLGTRVFGLDRRTSMLIGAGGAICGAAAVMATEPVVRARAHEVSVAVATVVVFGTLGMFAYPLLYPYLGLSEHAYGVFTGSTVHEVAQVVVAGQAVGEGAAAAAVIEKMLRVMMLAPFLLMLSAHLGRDQAEAQGTGLGAGLGAGAGGSTSAGGGKAAARRRQPIMIPWFAVLFILATAVHSSGILPASLVQALVRIDTLLLAMAMAALGLRTHAGAIRQAGFAPLVLAATLFVFLVVGGYAVNLIVTHLLG
ncbi:MAG: YeiH family putative sulfate export transporter [Burkholderiales bacterium]|nr:YeiH family putative sulfate export transporter [Burkholderiales bacterium]OJX05362.1 MAG: hypothetical protein BGO72_13995 [Burkholderiales bacterium 70-64]